MSDVANSIRRLMGMPAPVPPERLRAMLAARRATIDNVVSQGLPVNVKTYSPRMAQAMAGESLAFPGITNRSIADLSAAGQAERVQAGEASGTYFVPAYETPYQGIVTYGLGDRNVRRHEVMHAYNHAARLGRPGLPFWTRVAAGSPKSVAMPLDELLAQQAGGTRFMDIPWTRYAGLYAESGDAGAARVARLLAGAQAARRAADDPLLRGAALGAGASLGGAYALDRMYPDDPEQPAVEDIAGQFDSRIDILRRRRPGAD